MNIPKDELIAVLREFNPWWLGQVVDDLPDWERSATRRIQEWIGNKNTKRSLVLTGARQVGKTTLFRQNIRRMLRAGFPARNILYATFDHPILKLAGLKRTLEAWDEMYPPPPPDGPPRYLFLDEIPNVEGWQTWLKHQVDFKSGGNFWSNPGGLGPQWRRLFSSTSSPASILTDPSSRIGVTRVQETTRWTLSRRPVG